MTRPEGALSRARAAAARERARGGYDDDLRGFAVEPTESVGIEQLLEWAVIEPDPRLVYSTRRMGAPITALKQALLRMLRQYHGQLAAEQTRFNHHVALYLGALEVRVRRLEDRAKWADERGLVERRRGAGEPAADG